MKTKVKRLSKRTLAIILGVLMLSTCLIVGNIPIANAWSTSGSGIAMSTKIYTSSGEKSAWTVSGTNSSWYTDFDIFTGGDYEYQIIGDKWFGAVNGWNTPAFSDSNAYNYGYNAHNNNGNKNNITANFPAGQYVLHLTGNGGNDQNYISYTLYRKKAYVDFGWNSGSWSSYNMSYDSGGDGVYKYTITGNGSQLRFRTRFVDGSSETKYYPSSTDNIRDNTSYDGGYSASTGTSDNYWYVDTQNGAQYDVWLKNGKVWMTISGEGTDYYLTGYINGSDVTTRNNTYKFTETSTSGVYTLDLSSSTATQYVTIYDTDGVAYHPASHMSSSGTASATTDSSPGKDNKWMVSNASGKTVTFTWDTTGANPTLSWTVTGGSSSGTLTSYKVLYSTSSSISRLSELSGAKVYDLGNGSYSVNFSSFLGNALSKSGEYYIAISTSSNYTDILGGGPNSTGTCEVKDGSKYFATAQMQQNNVSSNNRYYYSHIKLINNPNGLKYVVTTSGYTVKYDYYASNTAFDDETGDDTGDDTTTVDVYAKDGAAPINWDNKTSGGASSTSGTAYNYAAIATTAITQIDGAAPASGVVTSHNVGDSSSQYQTASVATGKSITVTTTIADSNSWRNKYYVKGWCINGVTYKCDGTPGVNAASDTSSGVCTMTYTIPSEVTESYLEITPIYYLRDKSGCVDFYVEGYNTIQKKWGNTPYVYPFYGNLNNVDNSFGAYPGQPLVYADGKYSTEIPITNTPIKNATQDIKVKGITISNGYADHVHRNLIYHWTAHDNDADHKQTYDYDDFYKIYEERLKDGEHPNSIIFRIQDEEKVYNRSSYGGGKSGQFANSTSNINISTINSSGNGWELLKNRYDETVNIFGDHSAVSSLTPSSATADTSNAIYVVSTGYNANIAGDYGTMWKVYDGSGKLISKDTTNARYGIPPSLLHLRGTTSGYKTSISYPDADHSVVGVGSYKDSNSKYEGIYKALKTSYANKLVYVSFEKDTQDTRDDNSGTGAYRLDGQWFYTHASDYAQSTIGIEYFDKSQNKWLTDTVNASTGAGTTTGATAKFNDDSYLDSSHKTTSSSKVISANGTWNFTATDGTGYIFDSWQIKYSETSYDEIKGAGASASIGATSNYKLIARFLPVVTGSLTIDHTLSKSSSGEGSVDMTVLVKNGVTTLQTYNGSHIYIDGTYITNSHSSYTIDVTLKTTPQYDGKVTAFGYDGFNTSNSITATTSPSTLPGNENTLTTSHFTFTVGDLYAGSTLVTDSLAYTSTISETPHSYNFKYNFTDRGGAAKSYTSKGSLSLKEYKEYVSGSHTMDQSYLISKAPFESNFLKSNTLSKGTISYNSSTHTFSATSTFNQSDSVPTYSVFFKLPYNYYNASGSTYKKYNANGNSYVSSKEGFSLVAKYNTFVTVNATSSNPDETQANVSKITDASDVNHTGNSFLTAPDELMNNSTKMYFSYWLVKKEDSEGDVITKIYYPDFNYRVYNDYYVEAVYSSNASDSWHMKYSDNDDISCSIMYLGDSRNQWNSDSVGTDTSDITASDIIYNDFIFKYNNGGKELKGSSEVQIGMIIERVPNKATNPDGYAKGSSSVNDMSSYKASYGDSETARKTSILNKLRTNSLPKGCVKEVWDTADLNNKNFMEQSYYAYSQYGQKDSDGTLEFNTDSDVDDYVYRAYAYMKYDSTGDGTPDTYVLSDASYFCMKYTSSLKYTE